MQSAGERLAAPGARVSTEQDKLGALRFGAVEAERVAAERAASSIVRLAGARKRSAEPFTLLLVIDWAEERSSIALP